MPTMGVPCSRYCRVISTSWGSAPGPAAQYKEGVRRHACGGQTAGGERAEILEADASAFEMIFYQAKVLACRVLDDGNHVHWVRLVGGENKRVVAAFTIGHG